MTRKEEIKLYLKERNIPFSSLEANSITEGAQWADETMIEKATQWLFENVYDYLNPKDQERVESFRKAMDE